MSIIVLREIFDGWDWIPLKVKEIVEDCGYMAKRHCQEPLVIESMNKSDTDYTFYCRRFPKSGTNGVLRVIEIFNEIYQFDHNREIIPFCEKTDSGFLIRCCWNTHSMNKKYRKEAMI